MGWDRMQATEFFNEEKGNQTRKAKKSRYCVSQTNKRHTRKNELGRRADCM